MSLTHFLPQVKPPRMERYVYPSFGCTDPDAVCGVSIYEHNGQTICIVSELPENHGTSITNRAEYVYRQVAQDYKLDPHATIFIEHYYPNFFDEDEDSYDRVFFTITPAGEFKHPEWSRLGPEAVRELIGAEPPVAPSPNSSPRGRGGEEVRS